MSDTFDSAQIGFYKGNLDIVLADYEAVTKRDTEAAASLLPVSKGAKAAEGLKNIEKVIPDGKTMGNAKLAKAQGGDIGGAAIKGTPENKITKPALSTEQANKVFVDSKSDLATLVNNTQADYIVSKKGLAFSVSDLKNLFALQGTSKNVGKWEGLTGASFEEIFSRAPKNWIVKFQDKGVGIKFVEIVDGKEIEKIRIHGPSLSKHIPENSNARQGWVLRIPADEDGNFYFDDTGKILKSKTNETHIPIKGNPNAN